MLGGPLALSPGATSSVFTNLWCSFRVSHEDRSPLVGTEQVEDSGRQRAALSGMGR